MIRSASILASVLLVGCMSARGSDLLVDLPLEARPGAGRVEDDSAALAAASEEASLAVASTAGTEAMRGAEAFEPSLPSTPARGGLRESRFTVKGGYYSSEDAEDLDDGYIVNLSWMQFRSPHFAMEFEVGYFEADGEDGVVESEVWGIPFMVNGRINLPISVVDLYGGAGVGEFYYDAERDSGVVSIDADGWLFGGNAFVGATLNLGDSLALGLEAKYYLSEEIDDLDVSLDAFAVMLTLGFGRKP